MWDISNWIKITYKNKLIHHKQKKQTARKRILKRKELQVSITTQNYGFLLSKKALRSIDKHIKIQNKISIENRTKIFFIQSKLEIFESCEYDYIW